MLSWEPPLPVEQNGRIVHYHVIVTDAGFALNRNLTYGVSDGYIQLIDRLDADTSYAVRIAAATNSGIGPFSVTRTVTTLRNGKLSSYSDLYTVYNLLPIVYYIESCYYLFISLDGSCNITKPHLLNMYFI